MEQYNIIHSIEKAKTASRMLSLPYLKELAENIERGCNTEKISITIIGNYKAVSKLISSLFEIDDVMPIQIKYQKHSTQHIKITYADSLMYKLQRGNGSSFIVAREQFLKVLSNDKDVIDLTSGEICLNNELLKTLTISLYFTDIELHNNTWGTLLVQSDYTFVVLNATQLLSLSEQQFISNVVNNICNPERYSLVVASMEHINEQERDDVLSYVDTFTMSINNTIPRVIPYGKDEITPFVDFVKRHIILNAVNIRENTNIQNAAYIDIELMRTCNEVRSSLLKENKAVSNAMTMLSANCDSIQKSIKSTERSIDIFILGRIKSQFINNIDNFSSLLDADLRKEIVESEDIGETTQQLPLYLKSIWEQFIERQNLWLKGEVFKELIEISKCIENDIKQVISTIDADTIDILKEYLPAKFRYNAFISPKRDRGDSLKYVDLGAIGMLLISVPWAIIIFTTSQLIRYFFKGERLLAKKESLAESAISSSNKMKNQIINQADIEVENIADSMKSQAKGVYQTILLDFTNAIEAYQNNIDNSEELIDYIDTLCATEK